MVTLAFAMSDVIFTPFQPAKKEYNTAITKESFAYGLVHYGQRVVETVSTTTAGTRVLFTVPDGVYFYLTGVSLTLTNVAALSTSGQLTGGGKTILRIELPPGNTNPYTQGNTSLSFSHPVIYKPGEVIALTLNVAPTGTIAGTIVGYSLAQDVLANLV